MWLKEPIVAAILIVVIGIFTGVSLFYTQTTLRNIEYGLPLKIMEQEQDISLLSRELSNLVRVIQLSRMDNTVSRHAEVVEHLRGLEGHLKRIRSTYKLDNVLGATKIHAVIAPALLDMNRWLSKGLYDLAPSSDQVLALAETRASEAYSQTETLSQNADKKAFDLLSLQSGRIINFRNSVTNALSVMVLLAIMLVWYILRGRRATRLLQESESTLSAFMEHSPTEMTLMDMKGHYLKTNRYYRDLYDISDEEGKTVDTDTVDLSDITKKQKSHDQFVKDSGEAAEQEYVLNYGDETKVIRLLKFPIKNKNKKILAIGSVGTDVTALKKSEDRFRTYADIASDWFWELDSNFRFTHLSERFEEIMGISSTEVLGITIEGAFRKWIDRFISLDGQQNDLKDHKPYSMIFKVKVFSGAIKIFHAKATPTFNKDGKFLGYRGVGTDITEQKQTEDRLLNSEQRFKDFATIASDYLWETDSDLRYTFLSEQYRELTGLPNSELLGRSQEEVYSKHVPDKSIWQPYVEALKVHDSIDTSELEWIHPDNKRQFLRISAKQLVDVKGIFQGYRGIASDITDITLAKKMRKMRNTLQKLQTKKKQTFLQILAMKFVLQ